MKILFVLPGLPSDGAALQLALLARDLPRDRFDIKACVLGEASAVPPPLADAVALGWSRAFDPRPLWRLRRLVRKYMPDVIHACRPAALRALRLATGRIAGRLIVSHPFVTPARGPKRIARLDAWLARRAHRVLVRSASEADTCITAGLDAGRIAVIPPCADIPHTFAPAPAAGGLMCAGRLEPHKGCREAIWTLDILRFIYDDITLTVVGDGPDRPRLERFARQIDVDANVRFAGHQREMPRLFQSAQVVWVPSLSDSGVTVALEAMAAGRPVVGSDVAGLRNVIADGETGFLVPANDKPALAKATRRLIDNEDLRQRMGSAAREHVSRRFSVAACADQVMAVYADVA